jgi:pimeloyl-ACP methyl ester carboxylesterase
MLRKQKSLSYLHALAKRLFGRITSDEGIPTMLNHIQKYEQIFKEHPFLEGTLATAALGALTLDQFAGNKQAKIDRTEPSFHSTDNDSSHALVVLPGCQMDGEVLFNQLAPLAPNSKLIVADYPRQGFDIEAVCEGLAQQLKENKITKPSFLCHSMGGMVMRHFTEYAEKTGLLNLTEGLGNIVLDAAPFDAQDIRPRYRLLLKAVGMAQKSWAINHIKPLFLSRGHGWSAYTPLGAIHGQGKFMVGEHPTVHLDMHAESVSYFHGATLDPVIDTYQSIQKPWTANPANLKVFQDSERPAGSHTADLEQMGTLIGQTISLVPNSLVAA